MPGWISDSRATLAFRVGQWAKVSGKLQARLDEGISSFYPQILVYMENPCRDNK